MIGEIVKVCGLTREANIRMVIETQPDWIGLIFYPPSPRNISKLGEVKFLNDLKIRQKKIAVFVNPVHDEVDHVTDSLQLDGIQFHGNETPEFCEKWRNRGYQVIKAFGLSPDFAFHTTIQYEGSADYLLFDTGSPKHGGTGQQFDWDLLYEYEAGIPFILSGGISPETSVFPDHPQFAGVDLNSRFEASPGIKDIDKLNLFITRFRNG